MIHSDQHLISILFPVYNTEGYLDECIASITNQDFQNWELIAIDDFSTDHSHSILNQWAEKDDRIKVFINQSKGIIPALQLAYSKSTGTYVTRMDSDDIMPPNKLSSMIKAWKQGTVVTGKVAYFSDDVLGDGYIQYADWINERMDSNDFHRSVFKECVIPSQCWLMSRNDLDKIGAFSELQYPEDYDLCFRMLENQMEIVALDQIVHHWRDRSDRISRTGEHYRDNRFFELKWYYFKRQFDVQKRPIVIWGAGRNGKDLVKILHESQVAFAWVCENENKIGHQILGVKLSRPTSILSLENPLIIISVASPEGKQEISNFLNETPWQEGKDYWFWL